MSIKIDYRMEFERSKKAIAVQGVLEGYGSVTFIDKKLHAKYQKDFNTIQAALDEFFELVDEMVAREAGMVVETIHKCKGEEGEVICRINM